MRLTLTIQRTMFPTQTTCLNIKNIFIFPHIILIISSHHFPKQHWRTSVCNTNAMFFVNYKSILNSLDTPQSTNLISALLRSRNVSPKWTFQSKIKSQNSKLLKLKLLKIYWSLPSSEKWGQEAWNLFRTLNEQNTQMFSLDFYIILSQLTYLHVNLVNVSRTLCWHSLNKWAASKMLYIKIFCIYTTNLQRNDYVLIICRFFTVWAVCTRN
jgi:hypothetical protein